jgi:hypothetical protein
MLHCIYSLKIAMSYAVWYIDSGQFGLDMLENEIPDDRG